MKLILNENYELNISNCTETAEHRPDSNNYRILIDAELDKELNELIDEIISNFTGTFNIQTDETNIITYEDFDFDFASRNLQNRSFYTMGFVKNYEY